MTRPKVLISDSMSSQAAAIFAERGVEVVQCGHGRDDFERSFFEK